MGEGRGEGDPPLLDDAKSREDKARSRVSARPASEMRYQFLRHHLQVLHVVEDGVEHQHLRA